MTSMNRPANSRPRRPSIIDSMRGEGPSVAAGGRPSGSYGFYDSSSIPGDNGMYDRLKASGVKFGIPQIGGSVPSRIPRRPPLIGGRPASPIVSGIRRPAGAGSVPPRPSAPPPASGSGIRPTTGTPGSPDYRYRGRPPALDEAAVNARFQQMLPSLRPESAAMNQVGFDGYEYLRPNYVRDPAGRYDPYYTTNTSDPYRARPETWRPAGDFRVEIRDRGAYGKEAFIVQTVQFRDAGGNLRTGVLRKPWNPQTGDFMAPAASGEEWSYSPY